MNLFLFSEKPGKTTLAEHGRIHDLSYLQYFSTAKLYLVMQLKGGRGFLFPE